MKAYKIKEYMRTRGRRQIDIAEEIGIAQSRLSTFLAGHRIGPQAQMKIELWYRRATGENVLLTEAVGALRRLQNALGNEDAKEVIRILINRLITLVQQVKHREDWQMLGPSTRDAEKTTQGIGGSQRPHTREAEETLRGVER